MYLIQRLSEKQIAKYRTKSQMAINGLKLILQESDKIVDFPNVGSKWKYIADYMGLSQENGNSYYNYFVSLNNDTLFLVRNGNHNNTNSILYNMHEKLGRPNKRYVIFFNGMDESTDITTNFLEAEHHTVNYPVNALDTNEDVQNYILTLIRLFENGETEFPKLPSSASKQTQKLNKDNSAIESENRLAYILTEEVYKRLKRRLLQL